MHRHRISATLAAVAALTLSAAALIPVSPAAGTPTLASAPTAPSTNLSAPAPTTLPQHGSGDTPASVDHDSPRFDFKTGGELPDAPVVKPFADSGYALLSGVRSNAFRYEIRLISTPGVEAYRGFAQAAASELTAAGLANISVAPGQFSDPGGVVPANTIYIGAFTSSPCGSGSGIAGCGGPYLGKSRAVTGNGAIVLAGRVWILPPTAVQTAAVKKEIVAHEIGHTLGLAHYSGTYGGARPVMYPSAAPTASYQAGDRNGLSYLRGENPMGALDTAASPGTDKVRVTGWSFDPDQSAAATFAVTVDGARAGGGTTSLARADVNARYGVTGSRGFDVTVTAPGGLRQVCVTATNYPVGNQQSLGCRTVVVSGAAPEGSYDTIAQTPGHSITVTGWALDRDNPTNSAVTLTIDGTPVTTTTTNQLRTDINTKYTTTGTRGFTLTAPTTPGTHTACITTPDYPQLTSKTTLGCRTIRIP